MPATRPRDEWLPAHPMGAVPRTEMLRDAEPNCATGASVGERVTATVGRVPLPVHGEPTGKAEADMAMEASLAN